MYSARPSLTALARVGADEQRAVEEMAGHLRRQGAARALRMWKWTTLTSRSSVSAGNERVEQHRRSRGRGVEHRSGRPTGCPRRLPRQ